MKKNVITIEYGKQIPVIILPHPLEVGIEYEIKTHKKGKAILVRESDYRTQKPLQNNHKD